MGLFSKLRSQSPNSSKAKPSSSTSTSSTIPTTTQTGIVTSQASPRPANQATTAQAPGSSKTPVDNNKDSDAEDKSDDELEKTDKTKKKGKKEVSLRRNILATITLSAVGAGWSV